jgi:hypothetical protein
MKEFKDGVIAGLGIAWGGLFLAMAAVRFLFKAAEPPDLVVLLILLNTIPAALLLLTVTGVLVYRFGGFTLNRLARSYGLNREQKAFLGQILRAHGGSGNRRIPAYPAILDGYFKAAYRSIAQSPETPAEKQKELARLFSLRNIIDKNQNRENLVRRKTRRQEIAISCRFCELFFLPVFGPASGPAFGQVREYQKLLPYRRKFLGIIVDISLGGCGIETSAYIAVGSKLWIEIARSGKQRMAVFGRVLRITRGEDRGDIILHIKFIKVSRKARNAINAMVFEYVRGIKRNTGMRETELAEEC